RPHHRRRHCTDTEKHHCRTRPQHATRAAACRLTTETIMEFALSDDQRLMQESLHRAFERICPLGHVRSIVTQGDTLDAELWQDLTRLGLPGLLISEKHTGLGMGLLDAALAAEAMGRHIVPAPFLGSCVLATLALQLAGSAEQQAHWL